MGTWKGKPVERRGRKARGSTAVFRLLRQPSRRIACVLGFYRPLVPRGDRIKAHMGANDMKISNEEVLRANQITPAAPIQPTPSQTQVAASAYGKGATPAAQVDFSEKAQAISVAAVAVDAAPDTRDDLVSKIKAQVDAGAYKVSGADIADQMLRRAQADRIS